MSTLTQFFGGGSVIKSIQRGTGSAASSWTTQNITISAVDTTKAFVIAQNRNTETSIAAHSITYTLTTSTNLQIVRSTGTSVSSFYSWQVIEYV